MNACYEDLRNALEAIPSINAHLHQASHEAEEQPAEGDAMAFVEETMLDYAVSEYSAEWQAKSGREAWAAFLRAWPRIRCMGYGQMTVAKLRAIGLTDELTPASYDEIAKRAVRHTPDEARAAYERAGIRGSLTDIVGHSSFGEPESTIGDFLAGRFPMPEGFHPLLHTNLFHDLNTADELAPIERLADTEFGSAEDLAIGCCDIVVRAKQQGLIGLKDTRAYTRGVGYGAPDRSAAETTFHRLRAGETLDQQDTALSDFVFDALLCCAADVHLPVALHTGYIFGVAAKTNASQLAGLLERHPDVHFDLYHLNFPWLDDLFDLIHRFSNTTANGVWASSIGPASMERFLLRCLGSLPAERVIAFGSDGGGLGYVLATLSLTRDIVAGALYRLVETGRISRAAALDVARVWMYEAPCEAYGLPCS